MAKVKCPVCDGEVATPFFLNADAWRWLVCPHCAERLERKNPSWIAPLSSLLLAMIALGRLSHVAAVVTEVGMVGVFAVIVVEFARPQLQLRKALPKPEITLNINGSSN
jgi:endogenous inhibitor of DNA gyrase (YacG/DUF329 family)